MSGECKAIIFDLDGTLIDSAPDIAAAVNKHLSDIGLPTLEVEVIARFIGFGARRLIADVYTHIGHPADEAAMDAGCAAYLENYRQAPANRTEVFPCVREDLERLRAAGLRLGICTNKPQDMTLRVLAALEMDGFFDVIVGADAVPACKPDPGHLRAAAKRMGLADGDWVYVGDTPVDKAAAAGAGVPLYVVPWGGGAEVEADAARRLGRLADLLKLTRKVPS